MDAAISCSMLGALLLACAPSQPGSVDVEAVSRVSAQVDGLRVIEGVELLVEAHRRDVPLDCTTLGQQPARLCHLTRVEARKVMEEQLSRLGYTVRREHDAEGPFSTTNIVAELPGAVHADEVVVVGAHYDAFYSGADDNSTGVAAVLELARVLSQLRFDRTIRFVGFDLEELGLVGSFRYLEGGAARDNIVAGIIFDSIGYADHRPGSQRSLPGLPDRDVGDFIAAIGNSQSSRHALELREVSVGLQLPEVLAIVSPSDGAFPLTGELLRSDHTPFWLEGKPALLLTDTANFRNPHYHVETDTVGTLDTAFLTGVVRLAAGAVAHWAGGPR